MGFDGTVPVVKFGLHPVAGDTTFEHLSKYPRFALYLAAAPSVLRSFDPKASVAAMKTIYIRQGTDLPVETMPLRYSSSPPFEQVIDLIDAMFINDGAEDRPSGRICGD